METATLADDDHDDHPTYTVDELKQKAAKHLANHDTVSTCGEIYQASTLSLVEYVKKLESVSSKLIVPPKDSWNFELYDDLCHLLKRKAADERQKLELAHGWVMALVLQARGRQENALDVEEVSRDMPYVLRFIEITQNELPVTEEMAAYIGKKLFTKSFVDQAVELIKKESESGRIDTLFKYFKLSCSGSPLDFVLFSEIYQSYKKHYNERLIDVLLLKNRDELNRKILEDPEGAEQIRKFLTYLLRKVHKC